MSEMEKGREHPGSGVDGRCGLSGRIGSKEDLEVEEGCGVAEAERRGGSGAGSVRGGGSLRLCSALA